MLCRLQKHFVAFDTEYFAKIEKIKNVDKSLTFFENSISIIVQYFTKPLSNLSNKLIYSD